MGRGDSFNSSGRSKLASLNPDAPKWGDEVLYLLRIITASDLPPSQQAIVKVDGELPAIVAKLNELKSELQDLDGNTDQLESKLDDVIAAVEAIDLTSIEALLGSVETLLTEIAASVERDIYTQVMNAEDKDETFTYVDVGTADQRVTVIEIESVTVGKKITETITYSGSAGNFYPTGKTRSVSDV